MSGIAAGQSGNADVRLGDVVRAMFSVTQHPPAQRAPVQQRLFLEVNIYKQALKCYTSKVMSCLTLRLRVA
jgi:hypothetical protein